jgi:enamine deaminase RidA (YjgF/YER057c/UK114 family)
MKKIINPVEGAALHDPKRVGGWHHAAIRVGDLIFMSGFVGVYPGTKTLGETTEKQVRLIYENAELALKAHGGTLHDIVRTTIYFSDRDATWPILDKVRRELFPDDPPVSTGIGVTKIDLNAALEIEFTAAIGSSK